MYEEIKCPILGYTLTFPAEINHDIKFHKYVNDFYDPKSKALKALWKDAKNLDVLLENCPAFLNQTIVEALEVIVSILKEYGVSMYTPQEIYDNFEDKFDYTEDLGVLYAVYESICNGEANIRDYYAYKRSLPHSRLVGGGFGIKGAVKGILTAEAINVSIGAVRGLGNFVAQSMRQATLNLEKEKVYNSRETQQVLNKSLSLICNSIIPICKELISEHTETKIAYLDTSAAHKLFIDSAHITDRVQLIEQLLDSLGKNPFNVNVYKSAVARLDDKDNRIQEMAKLFLCDDVIGDYKYNIADDILVHIANDEFNIVKRKYEGNAFAKRLMTASDVSEFDERLETLVDEKQGITLLKFFDRVKDGKNVKILEFIGDTFFNKANQTSEEKLNAANAYLRAADCGSASCALKIANMLRDNLVTLPDDDNAIVRYYTIAIEKDNTEAMCNLGVLYLEGNVIPTDIEQGKVLLQKAVDMLNVEAMYLMGVCKLKNIGFANQQEEGKNMLSSAYDMGSVKAAEFLAIGYRDGNYGLQCDMSLALQWYKNAAELGSDYGMLQLGHMYRKGNCVHKDLKEAEKWYAKASKIDTFYGYYNLGLVYEEMGELQAALNCYMKAYKNGTDKEAPIHTIGTLYWKIKEYKEAVHWYSIGDRINSAFCQYSLGMLYGRGQGVPVDYNKCAKYLITARDNPNATDDIKNLCKETLAMLNYDGRRWTKKMFVKI